MGTHILRSSKIISILVFDGSKARPQTKAQRHDAHASRPKIRKNIVSTSKQYPNITGKIESKCKTLCNSMFAMGIESLNFLFHQQLC